MLNHTKWASPTFLDSFLISVRNERRQLVFYMTNSIHTHCLRNNRKENFFFRFLLLLYQCTYKHECHHIYASATSLFALTVSLSVLYQTLIFEISKTCISNLRRTSRKWKSFNEYEYIDFCMGSTCHHSHKRINAAPSYIPATACVRKNNFQSVKICLHQDLISVSKYLWQNGKGSWVGAAAVE